MAFNKVSMVFFVLLVSATIANARLFESESTEKLQHFCSSCECTVEDRETKCTRMDRKIGGCPKTCGEPCLCTRMNPPTCWCTYEVDTCSPSLCSVGTATKLVNVLGLN